MIRIGGGGNDARFLMGILIRAAPGLLLRIAWHGLAYWPRRALESNRQAGRRAVSHQRAGPNHNDLRDRHG